MEIIDLWLENVVEVFKTWLERTQDHHNQSNIMLEGSDILVKIIEVHRTPQLSEVGY